MYIRKTQREDLNFYFCKNYIYGSYAQISVIVPVYNAGQHLVDV